MFRVLDVDLGNYTATQVFHNLQDAVNVAFKGGIQIYSIEYWNNNSKKWMPIAK